MHELALSSAIVNTVAKHAAGRRVATVNLRVGRLRQVVPDTLAFYFEFVARDTVCEAAQLVQELIEPRLRCRDCHEEWTIDVPAFRCPRCAGAQVEILSGGEFEVESIEVESRSENADSPSSELEEDACIGQR
jgi:hydrogenase nickel incorporation protein HypA/HybF